MPGFDFLDRVEQYVRTGTFPPEVDTKAARHVVKRASQQYIYKDKRLWKSFKGRLLKVVRSEDEMIEILTRYHEDNDHAGLQKMVKQILSLYFWSSVTEAVKGWLMKCPQCRVRAQLHKTVGPHRQQCLAYCCDSNSWNNPESVTFYRFPKDPALRDKWLAVAQRDKASLRTLSSLCAKHFDASCFLVDTDGQVTLKPDAVPTIVAATLQEDELPIAAEEDSLQISSLEELIAASDAAETIETTERPEPRMDLPEHQYAFPPPEHNRMMQLGQQTGLRKTSEPCFVMYDNIERYLKHGILPQQTKSHTFILRRASRRFGVINGVLMYTKVSPPVKVLRSREEVIAVMRHFHDNQGHRGQGMCQRAIVKQFYWATLSRDLATWISTCDTCINRPKKRRFRCSVYNCTNYSGPIERGLGMTFHKFPVDNPTLLTRWLRNLGRPHWHPSLWSSVCSSHFTEDCFDRSEGEVRLHPDSVPSLFIYSDPVNQARITPTQPPPLEAVTTQDQIFFAKYDAVERYLRRGHYPPGLNGVEKNTLRRFAKSFIIKDDELHIVRGNKIRRVLRNREEVEMALVNYHDELNHLDLDKCIRLLNERCFWKTMRPDVVRWIDNCSQCSAKKIKKAEPSSYLIDPNQSLGSPQIPTGSPANSDYDDNDDDDDDDDDDDEDDEDDDEDEDEDSYEEDDDEMEEEEEEEEVVRKRQSKSRTTKQTSGNVPAPSLSQPEIAITSTQETPPSMQPQPPSSTPSQSEDTTITTTSQAETTDIQLTTINCSDETEAPPSPSSQPTPPSSLIWVVRRVSTQPVSPSQPQIQTEENESEGHTGAEPQSPVHFEIISQTQIQTQADPIEGQVSESDAQAQDPDQQPLQFHFITHPQTQYETNPQPQPEVQTEVSVTETQDQSTAPIQPQHSLQTEFTPRAPPQATPKRSSQTLPQKKRNSASKPKASTQKTKLPASKAKQAQVSRAAQAKKRKGPETKLPAKRNKSGSVLEPAGSQKSKQWTVSKAVWTETIKRLKTEENREQPVDPEPLREVKMLQARVMVQHCTQARVKVKPAVDGAEAQWAEIGEGMVAYVCFFQGATEDIVKEMANTLMKAKLFRNTLKRPSSVLELPGSVLLIPQDSLVGEQQVVLRKRIQYDKACAIWWGAQLYAKLVSACQTVMAKHASTSALGITVEHGTYGQKQELVLSSSEPLTHLLEF